MKDNIADGSYVALVALLATLDIHTLNDALTTISMMLAIMVGAGRFALIVKEWRGGNDADK